MTSSVVVFALPQQLGRAPCGPFRSASWASDPPPRAISAPRSTQRLRRTRSSTRPRQRPDWKLSEGRWGRFWRIMGTDPTSPAAGRVPSRSSPQEVPPPPSSDPRFDLWTISAADPAAPRPWSTSSREATRASSSIAREASARSSAPFRASRPRAASACAAGAKTASSASSAPRATTPSLPRTPPNPPQPVTSRLGSRQCRPRRPSSRPS